MGVNSNEIDIFRDSPVRYLGYANEVGEAFRSLVKKVFVHASYGVAIAYVLVDTGDKAKKQYDKPELLGGGVRPAFVAAGDTLLWQMFASVIIPGLTINRICWATAQGLKAAKFPRSPARLWAPTIIGLASIPLIIHPIDNFVHMLMDKSYRKYVR